MRTEARLVIIGVGIVGCSAAYHLTRLGWRDILVIDKGPLFKNDGSTSHAPGSMFLTNPSKMMTEFARYSAELFGTLEDPEDGPPLYRPVGGIEVATTRERLADLKRRHGWATSYGVESFLITPAQVKEKIPLVDERVILGGFYVPGDTNINGWHTARALARAAVAEGAAEFIGDTAVTDIEVRNGRVTGVLTSQGRVATEQVLLCANIWAPVLAEKVAVPLPLLAAQHLHSLTSVLPELAGETREIVHPMLRHQDFSMYFRQFRDRYGVGSYRHEPLMVDPRDLGKTAMLPFTPEHYEVAWQAGCELMPTLKNAELVDSFNGMFAFTVDGYPIMGEASHLKGFWSAVGVWIAHAGGVGRAIAEWMTEGEPSTDLREADINRFHAHQTTRAYIQTRCAANYREVYDIIHPLRQSEDPRDLRLSPFHARLVEQQGIFFANAGWEAPQWYEANASLLKHYEDRIPKRSGWAGQNWSPIQGAEHLALRDRVGLVNMATLATVEVSGAGAVSFLDHLCANRVDRPIGQVVYTSLLTPRGRIKCDLTLVRRAEDRFWIFTGGGFLPHDLAWLRHNAPTDGSVHLVDLSSGLAGFGLCGPHARQVLQEIVEEDVSNEAFPYYTAQTLTIGHVPVYALRVSYAGELGWEVHAPTEYAGWVWDRVWKAGLEFGILAAGAGAFDSLRLEKGYRLWGADIHTEYNPFEAGLGWAVRLNKGDFIGREALLKARDQGIQRRLCCLTLDDRSAVLLGKEPILSEDRKLGYVTSANFGYSVGAFIAYGYLPVEYAAEGTSVEVEYFGERYAATVRKEPLFDAAMTRLRN